MNPFDFHARTRLVFGVDKIDSLGQLAAELDVRRALVVSDVGVIRAGHTQRGLDALQDAGLDTTVFQEFRENPNTEDVERGAETARQWEPDLLVGLGGGSSLDCAKGINFLYSSGGRMQNYWGVGKATSPMLPMVAVPTTAGTGSEAQSFALISDAQTHVKMACGDKKAACRVALLDPRLTLTMPRRVTALTGIDALAHALETYVTKPRNPLSLTFSREAWRLLAANFARVLDDGEDIEARSGMQLGACFAGTAIENSMLGAAHALANPLTAAYGVVHGEAVALMLPAVIRFNGEAVGAWYAELLPAAVGLDGIPAVSDGVEGLAGFVEQLGDKAGLKRRLSECGVERDRLPQLAADAAKQWTGTFNPRELTQPDLLQMYEQAY